VDAGIVVDVRGPALLVSAISHLVRGLPGMRLAAALEGGTNRTVVLLLGRSWREHRGLPDPTAPRVLVTTGDVEELRAACAMGLTVFASEDDVEEQLAAALQAAVQRRNFCSPLLVSALLQAAQPVRLRIELRALTNRQLEAAYLASGGLRDREIAERLFLSVTTTKVHVETATRTLKLRRTQLAGFREEFSEEVGRRGLDLPDRATCLSSHPHGEKAS